MGKVTCTWTHRDEVFEGYVRDALSPEDRDAFEEHYFACTACLDKLQTYQALQTELGVWPAETPGTERMRAKPWRWVLVPVAAGVVLAALVAFWPGGPVPAEPGSSVVMAPEPQVPAVPVPLQTPPAAQAQPAPISPQAGEPPEAARQPKPPVPSSVVALSVLARVEPPLYLPLTLRGPRDEAAERFEAAMQHYMERDYAGAIPGLTAAADLNPKAAHITFFLGICHLLADRPDAGIDWLQKTIALGDSPYLEEAHFYAAKARLRQGNIPAAQEELLRTIERRGQLEADARKLRAQVDALAARR